MADTDASAIMELNHCVSFVKEGIWFFLLFFFFPIRRRKVDKGNYKNQDKQDYYDCSANKSDFVFHAFDVVRLSLDKQGNHSSFECS